MSQNKLLRNKRGGIVEDVMIGFMVVFIFMFITVITYAIWSNFNAEIQDLPESIARNETKAEIASWGGYWGLMDFLTPFIFLMLWVGAIMSALLVRPEHPFFFLVALVTLLIFTVVSFIIVDFSTAIFTDPLLLQYSAALSNISFFANNFHYISFFVMLGSAGWFWSKGSIGASQGGNQGIQ